MRGQLIFAGLLALAALTAFAVIPIVQQGWEKHRATVAEFEDNDSGCAAMQNMPTLNLTDEQKKRRHDVCMRDHGWSPLQKWQ